MTRSYVYNSGEIVLTKELTNVLRTLGIHFIVEHDTVIIPNEEVEHAEEVFRSLTRTHFAFQNHLLQSNVRKSLRKELTPRDKDYVDGMRWKIKEEKE